MYNYINDEVKEINIDYVSSKNNVVTIIGEDDYKRTKVISDILDKKNEQYINDTLIITSNYNFFNEKYPNSKVFSTYTKELFEEYLLKQNSAIIIDCVDDVMKDKNLKDIIAECIFNGRHYKKTIILSTNNVLSIKPEFRSNFDYIFLLDITHINNLKKIYDYYCGMFPTYADFISFYNVIIANNTAFVLNNRPFPKNDKLYKY
jgi:hypothetical protein